MFQQTIGLIDKIFVLCRGRVFQQTIGIPMGANCASLLANLFLHDYQADFLQSSSQSLVDHYKISISQMTMDLLLFT
jgi:hypothetical protein